MVMIIMMMMMMMRDGLETGVGHWALGTGPPTTTPAIMIVDNTIF